MNLHPIDFDQCDTAQKKLPVKFSQYGPVTTTLKPQLKPQKPLINTSSPCAQNVTRLLRERQGAERERGRTQSQLEDLRATVRAAAVAEDPELDKTDEIEKLQEAVEAQRLVVRGVASS